MKITIRVIWVLDLHGLETAALTRISENYYNTTPEKILKRYKEDMLFSLIL